MSVAALCLLVLGAPDCEGAIEGRVVDAAQGTAVPRATVAAGGAEVETDAAGRYRLDGLCPGEARVTARRADYRPRAQAVRVPAPGPVDFALEPRAVTRLDDVIVEAPRLDPRDTRAVTRLEGDALDRTRGAHLADALREVPGVAVLRSGATAKPILRGLSGPRVLVLFDGVRHEGQDWGLDHGVEIDPFAAGSIEVVKGAAGVRYGPDAIAGVLLVEPPPMIEAPGLRAEVSLVGATNGRRGTVAARVDGRPEAYDRLALRLEGNVSRGRALETPTYALENTAIREWNVGGRAEWTGDDLTLTLAYHHFATENGLFSGQRNESPDDLRAQIARDRPLGADAFEASYAIERAYQSVTHDRVLLRGRYDAGDAGVLAATYAFQINLRREFDTVRSSVTGPQFDFTLRTHTVDATWAHPRWDLEGGRGLSGTLGIALQLQENVFRGLTLIPNYRQQGVGAFVLERLALGEVTIEAGARYDLLPRAAFLGRDLLRRHRARGTLGDDDCEGAEPARCPRTFHLGAASLGALWDFAEGWAVKVDASSAARAPTIDEAYINGTSPSFPVLSIGEPRLGTETSWSLSSTLQASLPWLAAEASAYLSYVDDYIYLAPELRPDGSPVVDVIIRGSFPRFTQRAVDALLYGAEAQAKLRFGPVDLDLTGSLVRGDNLDTDEPLIRIPADRGRAAITYRWPPEGEAWAGLEDGWISVHGTFVRAQTRFDPAEDFAEPPAGYALLGAGLGATWRAEGYALTASLSADNLLDTRFRDYTSLLRYYADEPGRQVILRLGATWSP